MFRPYDRVDFIAKHRCAMLGDGGTHSYLLPSNPTRPSDGISHFAFCEHGNGNVINIRICVANDPACYSEHPNLVRAMVLARRATPAVALPSGGELQQLRCMSRFTPPFCFVLRCRLGTVQSYNLHLFPLIVNRPLLGMGL